LVVKDFGVEGEWSKKKFLESEKHKNGK